MEYACIQLVDLAGRLADAPVPGEALAALTVEETVVDAVRIPPARAGDFTEPLSPAAFAATTGMLLALARCLADRFGVGMAWRAGSENVTISFARTDREAMTRMALWLEHRAVIIRSLKSDPLL